MTDAVIIRRATSTDVGALVELAKTTFRDTYRLLSDAKELDDYVTTNFTPEHFASILEDPRSLLFVAASDARLVGYMLIRASPVPKCVTGPTPLEIARIYLRQDTIGSGIGARFMKLAFDTARQRRCQTLWLSAYDRNVHAVRFYQRFGFADVGTKDFLFGGTVYQDPVMAVNIASS